VAEVAAAPGGAEGWFARYLPGDLLLGDPAARDAFIHAVQACIPHRTLLPVGVERIVIDRGIGPGTRRVHAHERSPPDDTFTYALEVTAADGRVVERWQGLCLRAMPGSAFRGPWPAALLGPYVERRANELIPGSALAAVVRRECEPDGSV